MPDDVKVDIDQRALFDLLHDPRGPVGDLLRKIGDDVALVAEAAAPVSRRGSRFSPPGALKALTRRSFEVFVDDEGDLAVGIGSPLYPHSFVSSEAGVTRNRGGRSVRPARDRYLEDSLNTTVVWP